MLSPRDSAEVERSSNFLAPPSTGSTIPSRTSARSEKVRVAHQRLAYLEAYRAQMEADAEKVRRELELQYEQEKLRIEEDFRMHVEGIQRKELNVINNLRNARIRADKESKKKQDYSKAQDLAVMRPSQCASVSTPDIWEHVKGVCETEVINEAPASIPTNRKDSKRMLGGSLIVRDLSAEAESFLGREQTDCSLGERYEANVALIKTPTTSLSVGHLRCSNLRAILAMQFEAKSTCVFDSLGKAFGWRATSQWMQDGHGLELGGRRGANIGGFRLDGEVSDERCSIVVEAPVQLFYTQFNKRTLTRVGVDVSAAIANIERYPLTEQHKKEGKSRTRENRWDFWYEIDYWCQDNFVVRPRSYRRPKIPRNLCHCYGFRGPDHHLHHFSEDGIVIMRIRGRLDRKCFRKVEPVMPKRLYGSGCCGV